MFPDPHHLAALLNRACNCVGADIPALQRELSGDLRRYGLARPLSDSHATVFSAIPFFMSDEHGRQMQELISAIESVIAAPAYQALVLDAAPAIARPARAARSVLFGYDFHLTEDGVKLIEINTNAGGAMLNVQLLEAQVRCCPEARSFSPARDAHTVAIDIWRMFQEEWRLCRADAPLRRIAIVDETPSQQYLYPEFLLFKQLFESHGVQTVICDPGELRTDGFRVTHEGQLVDLIYNRLTDFYLDDQAHAHLREAYESDAAVITPHPRSHALYANKRNLTILSNEDALRGLNIEPRTIDALIRAIPRTEQVSSGAAERWWADRKRWFFKPASGYGSRGAYRGDKLTRGVFDDIVQGGYLAQALVSPSERRHDPGAPGSLKVDVRNYAYAGEVRLVAARLYQGQTTNFRTPGGGFAPVFFASPDRSARIQDSPTPLTC